ncbi:MAG: alpha-2-macroglobulin [Magnetococcales bacterium]|nr:alpha-2-macroglobulin [Magnetococcales bacterium]
MSISPKLLCLNTTWRTPVWVGLLLLLGLLVSGEAYPQAEVVPEAKVLFFSPQSPAKAIRQVAVRFSHPMVALGNPSRMEPFFINCPEPGTGSWSDSHNWVYNFDHDLSAGLSCTFTQKPDLATLNGAPVVGKSRYTVSAGGPTVLVSSPNSDIAEEQIFILGLNTPVDWTSIEANVHCDIAGVGEQVGVRLLRGQARREALQQTQTSLLNTYLKGKFAKGWGPIHANRLPKQGTYIEKFAALTDWPDSPIITVQCQRPLPNGAKVGLVWGKGIRASGGVETSQPQRLNFRVRPHFTAEFNCTRHAKHAQCIPILPMYLRFSTAIPAAQARQILLRDKNDQTYATTLERVEEAEDDAQAPPEDNPAEKGWVHALTLPGPFPEESDFRLEIPPDIRDRDGRKLFNQEQFPLPIKTDRSPALAKFAADFGIVEAKGDATLPVTVRNLEAVLPLDAAHPGSTATEEENPPAPVMEIDSVLPRPGHAAATAVELRGRRLRVATAVEFLDWMRRVDKTKAGYTVRQKGQEQQILPGATSVFAHLEPGKEPLETFVLPKPGGQQAFEVLGIPLPKPGMYVVELASDRLGAELHGEKKPYFAQTAVVVTNLAVHFKKGRNASLVWVTSLDQSRPVGNATVTVHDCHGAPLFTGPTDAQGIAVINQPLPAQRAKPACPDTNHNGYLVTARSGEDTTFLLSSWNEGIAPFYFNLPHDTGSRPVPLFGTVLDRSLLRAGETLSMKHFARQGAEAGLVRQATANLPKQGSIRHTGSGQKYPFSLTWDDKQSAESTWSIPKEARFGQYQVLLTLPNSSPPEEVVSGQFWVEAFRMPTLRASINPVQPEAIAPTQMAFDLQLSPLAGGTVGAVPVKLRGMLRPKSVQFEGYDDFEFANGPVKMGEEINAANPWERSETEDQVPDGSGQPAQSSRPLPVQSLTLNPAGSVRAVLAGLGPIDTPQELLAELEYQDTNGERLTSASRVTLLPSEVILGINPDRWDSNGADLKLHVVALDRQGRPMAKVPVTVDVLEQKYFSHRKRLLGGFYTYEHHNRVKPVATFCTGVTDEMGQLLCTGRAPVAGQLLLQARAVDAQQHASFAHTSVWVAQDKQFWFPVENNNRMDLLPEKRHYEPGEEAVLQVRMPFPEATVLVTVEREGVLDHFVQTLRGTNPTLHIPMQGHYAPNVFISALAVRGRATEVAATAMVDLGRPTFRIGYARLNVGWQAHTLAVRVTTDRPVYKVRESAVATIQVTPPAGQPLPADAEVALAAVDEGLLELRANDSWNLLATMMQPRAIAVETSTALGRVIGRRHYGLKSVAQGGGGGRMPAGRQLLKPLLLWQGRVKLDAAGRAQVTIPLNDALSSFRVVAVASAGEKLFGTGFTSLRTTQDVAIQAGLPPLVREEDHLRAGFTVRNGSEHPMQVTVNATLASQPRTGSASSPKTPLAPQAVTLAPGEGQEIAWEVTVPGNSQRLQWEIQATTDGAADRLLVDQEVIPVLAVQVVQSTLTALNTPQEIPVERPAAALADRGGIRVQLQDRLTGTLAAVREYMMVYPYTCLEQRISKAIVLQDTTAWQSLMNALPALLDQNGLAKYFASTPQGSEILTAYLLAIADENGWSVPEEPRQKMVHGLLAFVQGKIQRPVAQTLPVAHLVLRKLAALEALSRYQAIPVEILTSIAVEPEQWPTSALIDWLNLLQRSAWPTRDALRQKASDLLRARLAFQGGTVSFANRDDAPLWWMMVTTDSTANRLLLGLLKEPQWAEDMPRLARGALARQIKGHWDTTTANAWGVVAMRKFSEQFEQVPVAGKTQGHLAHSEQQLDWTQQPHGGTWDFPWPQGQEPLSVLHQGQGTPWMTIQSRAAIPLKQPVFNGYHIQRTVTPVERKVAGVWSRGDLLRVKLEMDAQTEMSWVVVNDPIPAGSSILGSGSDKDSRILTQGEATAGGIRPTFEERGFDALRAYYEWLPKGKWSLEYTVRLNNPGQFQLPTVRVEAMYAPEIYGELPLESVTVLP